MNFRTFLIITLLAVLSFAGYWLYINVPSYTLVNQPQGGDFQIQATGWEIFWKGWFFTIPSAFLAITFSLIFLVWLYIKADEADHEKEIARMTDMKAVAEEKAKTARDDAEKSLNAHREAVREQERQLEDREKRLARLESDIVKRIQAAEDRAVEAEKAAYKAKTKQERATFTLRKLKAKVAKNP